MDSFELLQFTHEKDVHEELEKLKIELKEIGVLLDDAKERQMEEQSIKI